MTASGGFGSNSARRAGGQPALGPRFHPSYLHPRYWPTWLALGLVGLCGFLPRRLSLVVGAGVGVLFYRYNAKRRAIAEVNLRLCFPEQSADERQHMLRQHFRAYGQSVLDLGLFWWASERRLERLARMRGLEAYGELLSQGRSVILITPHVVAIDLCGIMLSRLHPTISMMKALPNPVLNWAVWRGRTRFDGKLVFRSQGLRPLVASLRRGVSCYLMPDQDLGSKHAVFAPFFGVRAATLTTVGRMAGITGAAVLPCYARLVDGGRGYEIVLRAPMNDYPSGDALADATRMNAELEACIRAAPEQYMWTLKWFRTRPDDEPPPY